MTIANGRGTKSTRVRCGTFLVVLASSLLAARTVDGQTRAYPAEKILHYVRSNQDGTEAEHVSMYLESPERVQVYKRRALGTDAALVTGVLDPPNQRASQLIGGRLGRDGTQAPQAWLRHDLEPHQLRISFRGPEADPDVTVSLAGKHPWRMYDFDFADWNALGAGRRPPRQDFAVELVMAWPDAGPNEPPVRVLGEVRAEYRGEEQHRDRTTCRYEVSGKAFADARGGSLWLDAENGTVVEVAWGLPNHPGYRDFRLQLVGEDSGAEAWRQLLLRHYGSSGEKSPERYDKTPQDQTNRVSSE